MAQRDSADGSRWLDAGRKGLPLPPEADTLPVVTCRQPRTGSARPPRALAGASSGAQHGVLGAEASARALAPDVTAPPALGARLQPPDAAATLRGRSVRTAALHNAFCTPALVKSPASTSGGGELFPPRVSGGIASSPRNVPSPPARMLTSAAASLLSQDTHLPLRALTPRVEPTIARAAADPLWGPRLCGVFDPPDLAPCDHGSSGALLDDCAAAGTQEGALPCGAALDALTLPEDDADLQSVWRSLNRKEPPQAAGGHAQPAPAHLSGGMTHAESPQHHQLSRKASTMDVTHLSPLPQSPADGVEMAASASYAAWRDGRRLQTVEWLLPPASIDPAGERNAFTAATALSAAMLNKMTSRPGLAGELAANLLGGTQLTGTWHGENLAAVIMPTPAENAILQHFAATGPATRLVLAVNPRWLPHDAAGGGGARGGGGATEAVFSYTRVEVPGARVSVLRVYPGPWQVYAAPHGADATFVAAERARPTPERLAALAALAGRGSPGDGRWVEAAASVAAAAAAPEPVLITAGDLCAPRSGPWAPAAGARRRRSSGDGGPALGGALRRARSAAGDRVVQSCYLDAAAPAACARDRGMPPRGAFPVRPTAPRAVPPVPPPADIDSLLSTPVSISRGGGGAAATLESCYSSGRAALESPPGLFPLAPCAPDGPPSAGSACRAPWLRGGGPAQLQHDAAPALFCEGGVGAAERDPPLFGEGIVGAAERDPIDDILDMSPINFDGVFDD